MIVIRTLLGTRASRFLRRDPSPASAYIDPRVGRPAMQARPPLPFQYLTEPPSVAVPTNTTPASWGAPAVDVHSRGRGPASSTARYVRRCDETMMSSLQLIEIKNS